MRPPSVVAGMGGDSGKFAVRHPDELQTFEDVGSAERSSLGLPDAAGRPAMLKLHQEDFEEALTRMRAGQVAESAAS